jgi:hypothetical protein
MVRERGPLFETEAELSMKYFVREYFGGHTYIRIDCNQTPCVLRAIHKYNHAPDSEGVVDKLGKTMN